MDKYYHFTAYGTCLMYIRDTQEHNCRYISRLPTALFHVLIVLGITNNVMSVIVFIQHKYDKRLISRLLRYYYVCNISVVLFLFFDLVVNHDIQLKDSLELLKRFASFTYVTAFKTSNGILAYIAILRYVNCIYPHFISGSKQAYTLSYLVIMLIVTLSAGIHAKNIFIKYDLMDVDDVLSNAFYYLMTMTTIVIFNGLWVYTEKTRNNSMKLRGISFTSNQTNKIFKFAFFSAVMYVVTTLPGTLFFMLSPGKTWERSCDSCLDILNTGDYLIFFMISGCFFDNVIYYAVSVKYRKDLKWGLRRLAHGRSVRIRRSRTASRMHSRTGATLKM